MQSPVGSTGFHSQEHTKSSALISLQQTALQTYFNIVSDPFCNDGVPILQIANTKANSFGGDDLNLIQSQNGFDTQLWSWGQLLSSDARYENIDSLLSWRDDAALSHFGGVHTFPELFPDGNRDCARYVLNFLQPIPR